LHHACHLAVPPLLRSFTCHIALPPVLLQLLGSINIYWIIPIEALHAITFACGWSGDWGLLHYSDMLLSTPSSPA
jgi:hypothetical protein